jgi:hypothetical protein
MVQERVWVRGAFGGWVAQEDRQTECMGLVSDLTGHGLWRMEEKR